MKDTEIRDTVIQRFKDRCGKLAIQMKHAVAEFRSELGNLTDAYDLSAVLAELRKHGLNPDLVAMMTVDIEAVKADPVATASTKPLGPRSVKKRARRSRIRFTDLKPHVARIAETLSGGAEFTAGMVCRELKKENKFPFNHEHVSLILSRYLVGVTFLRKDKVEGGGNRKVRIYTSTSPVTVNPKADSEKKAD